MASDDSKPRSHRAPRPSYTISLIDPDTERTMSLKIGASTCASTLKSIVASRLLASQFSVSSILKTPVGVLVESVCTPFENLYESLSEINENLRKSTKFEVLFENSSLAAPSPSTSSSSNHSSVPAASSEIPSSTTEHDPFLFQPIGYISSCWPRKNGCPRQGKLAPHSQASLKLLPPRSIGSTVSAVDALDGITAFSHVWLIFVFHANQESRESGSDVVGSGHMRAKVHPPRLGGKSIGIYATRTPHRFLPIGLTAVALERVDGDTLYLSGVDLIDGTPILDIKPYVPNYDALPNAVDSSLWIGASSEVQNVNFEQAALDNLHNLAQFCDLFDHDASKIRLAIEETLLADPRSVYRKQKCATKSFGFRLDKLSIQCSVTENSAQVHSIQLHSGQNEETNPDEAE